VTERTRRNIAELSRADLEAVHALTLRVFANAPGDVGALLKDGCRELVRVLSARAAAIFLTAPGGSTLRMAETEGVPWTLEHLTIDLRVDSLSAEAVRTRLPVQSPDMTRDPRSQLVGRTDVPPLAVLGVPLAARAEIRGLVYVADRAGRRFEPGEIAVASALAAAVGVGVENAELWADTRRRVDELSLLEEAGRAIASSLDLDDVLREAAEAARRLVGTSRAFVLLHDASSGALRSAGGAGIDPGVLGVAVKVEPGSVLETVLRTRRRAVAEDVAASSVGKEDLAVLGGRALAAVPVLLRGELLGVLCTDEVDAPRRFTDSDLDRLGALADRLAGAIENARLYLETRRRAEQLGLLNEVGRSLATTLEIEQLLSAGIGSLARIVDAPAAYLALATEDRTALEVRAITGDLRTRPGTRVLLDPPDQALAALVFRLREPVLVEDALTDPRVTETMRRLSGARAYLGLPLLVRDRIIGTVIIVETRGPRLFTPAEAERAAAVANQLAVAAENARLYEDLRRSYAQLSRAQQQLVQGERLAALGELSAIVAHEVRNPLGVIFNSLGSLRRLVRPTGDAKMLFDIVEEESDRLNRIVGDLLDFARPSTPELRPELLGRVVEDALGAAVLPQAARIEIVRELDPGLPPVPIDARLVRQAVINVAVNAVQAMPRGGRLTLRALRDDDAAVVEIEDTGAGIPEEVRGRIFEPFFTTKASGTGLGLAVVRRIVEGHGGDVSVRTTPGTGTTFVLRFPLRPVEIDPAMR
jgi:signal transduction histidine kinase